MTAPSSLVDAPAFYLHVPYCAKKCGYCAFHSVPLTAGAEDSTLRMVEASLARAGDLSRGFEGAEFATAYVGGGTPTALPTASLKALLSGIGQLGGARGFREWTVEANPESLTADTLRIFEDAGVDRISLGIQSGESLALRAAGRAAGFDSGRAALDLMASGWKGRFSADLIAGLPGQTPRGLRADIARIASAGAEHLSVYDLTVEEGTPLAAALGEGTLRLPDTGETEDLWAAVKEGCAAVGLERYEVSNWALPGAECRHNLIYWRNGAWIGVGPSAVSSFPQSDGGTLRIEETRDHEAYIRDAAGGAREERISPATAAFETLMMAFRTREGLDAPAFNRRFGRSVEEVFPSSLEKWKDYLTRGPGGPAPTDRLLDILNRFLLDCMEELERTAAAGPDFPGGPS